MPAIETELQALKDNLLDMLSLVTTQMQKCRDCIKNHDLALAKEVVDDEKRVNLQELTIDRDCENILALYTPVATDLRLVLATLKIANDLERIGDTAKSLSRFLLNNSTAQHYKWIGNFNIAAMLDVLIKMLKNMGEALQKEDTDLATRTAKKDEAINEYHKQAAVVAADLLQTHASDAKALLTLFSLTRDLERAGDLTKNIAEELVFHIEAKVVKHKKRKT